MKHHFHCMNIIPWCTNVMLWYQLLNFYTIEKMLIWSQHMSNGQNIHLDLHLCKNEFMFLHIDNTHKVSSTLLTLSPCLRLSDPVFISVHHSILNIFPGSKPILLTPVRVCVSLPGDPCGCCTPGLWEGFSLLYLMAYTQIIFQFQTL